MMPINRYIGQFESLEISCLDPPVTLRQQLVIIMNRQMMILTVVTDDSYEEMIFGNDELREKLVITFTEEIRWCNG